MSRTRVALPAEDEAGNRLGSGVELRFYDDAALTIASTVYANDVSATIIAQPITPNTGTPTTLSLAAAAIDTTITVVSVTGLAAGHRIPISDGVNTVYRTITSPPNAGTGVVTLDSALGFAFANGTPVNRVSQRGLVSVWLDNSKNYWMQVKDTGSGELMDAVAILIGTPTAGVAVQLAGVTIGTRAIINFTPSSVVVVTDNPGGTRVDVDLSRVIALAAAL